MVTDIERLIFSEMLGVRENNTKYFSLCTPAVRRAKWLSAARVSGPWTGLGFQIPLLISSFGAASAGSFHTISDFSDKQDHICSLLCKHVVVVVEVVFESDSTVTSWSLRPAAGS